MREAFRSARERIFTPPSICKQNSGFDYLFAAFALRLQGKVAIITGGASGIGEATARLFVENGARVMIADIQDDLGGGLASDLGPAAAYKRCDVSVEADVVELVAHTTGKWGKLDIMFSNAGVTSEHGEGNGIRSLDMARFDRVMGVNARGTALALKHASNAMIIGGNSEPKKEKEKMGGGSIVCTASIAGSRGGASQVQYTASKHAVLGLVRAAAAELGPLGIRVNSVSPSLVATPMTLKFFRELAAARLSAAERELELYNESMNVLRGHTLRPIDVARAVLFLASDDAAFVTGHDLVVDGGITATVKGFPRV
jgi:NAD(P)-dependent dehydrogenase (short-subunit alcohol dehydrogenase family)